MPLKYDWGELTAQGRHVVVPGKTPREVSLLAKTYVERKFGPGTVVVSKEIPGGTFVVVAYVPPPRKLVVELPSTPQVVEEPEEFDDEHPDPDAVDDPPEAEHDESAEGAYVLNDEEI